MSQALTEFLATMAPPIPGMRVPPPRKRRGRAPRAVTPSVSMSTASSTSDFIKVHTYSHHEKRWKAHVKQPRRFDTITLPAEQKADLIADLRKFEAELDWYHAKNIPYRRGYFLYGPPGTGKTSIATAIATETGRPVYFMPPDLDVDAVTTIPSNAVVLLEDADKMITNKDATFRQVEPEPIPVTTSYPTINPDEHHLWMKAIRCNETIQEQYQQEYQMYDANFDAAAAGNVTLFDSLVEGTLTDMKNGFAEPRPPTTKRREVSPGVFEDRVEAPGETAAEFAARRAMYKNIIKEANRLRREHYDTVRFDQERIGLLLQIIDGALAPYGAIFVMTTNRRHDIHTAMLRAGRMDKVYEIDYMSEENAAALMTHLGAPPAVHDALLKTIRVPGRALSITAADVQGAVIEWKKTQKVV